MGPSLCICGVRSTSVSLGGRPPTGPVLVKLSLAVEGGSHPSIHLGLLYKPDVQPCHWPLTPPEKSYWSYRWTLPGWPLWRAGKVPWWGKRAGSRGSDQRKTEVRGGWDRVEGLSWVEKFSLRPPSPHPQVCPRCYCVSELRQNRRQTPSYNVGLLLFITSLSLAFHRNLLGPLYWFSFHWLSLLPQFYMLFSQFLFALVFTAVWECYTSRLDATH